MDQYFEFVQLGSNNLLFVSVKCSNFGLMGALSLFNAIIAAGCLLCCIRNLTALTLLVDITFLALAIARPKVCILLDGCEDLC